MASSSSLRIKYALTKPDVMLRIVQRNIYRNLRDGNPAKVQMLPLVQRAFILVNESGVIPYKDYDADTEFLKEQ